MKRFNALALGNWRIGARRGGWLVVGVAGGFALMVAGCRMDTPTAVHLNSPEKNHKISFRSLPERLYLEIPDHGGGLSEHQKLDLHRFLLRYKRQALGPLYVSSPRSGHARLMAQSALRAVSNTMTRLGLNARNLRVRRHSAKYRGANAIRLAFRRPVAIAPKCGDWSEDLGVDPHRVFYPNFGCSVQRNIAKTVANSRDLIKPQPVSPRSSERRSETWSKYVKGSKNSKNASSSSEGASGAKPTKQ